MLDRNDIMETIKMISEEHLDIRTVTMGISLLSCAGSDADAVCEKVYEKITDCLIGYFDPACRCSTGQLC